MAPEVHSAMEDGTQTNMYQHGCLANEPHLTGNAIITKCSCNLLGNDASLQTSMENFQNVNSEPFLPSFL